MKVIFKKMGWFIKREWKKYLMLFLLLVVISFLALVPAYLLGYAIDDVTSGDLKVKSFIIIVFLMILFPVIRYLTSFFYNYQATKLSENLSFELRENYLSHLFKMDLSFYSKYDKGDLINRVTSDLESITVASTNLLEGLVFNLSMIVVTIILMLTTVHINLTLISISIMPIGLTILNIIRNRKRKYIHKHRIIYAKMTETILESVEGQKTIRAYGMEKNDLEKQNKAILDDINSWRYIVNYENWFVPLFEIIYGVSYVLAFSFGVYYIIQGELSVGKLITFVSYIAMLYGPIIQMSTIFNQINNAEISLNRYDEILKEEPKVKDDIDSKKIIDFNVINFNNVTFKYPFDEHPVINNMTFEIKKGETIGIVGPTGSGKSTLVRQLLREFNVTNGEILIDGIDIEKYVVEDIRNLVGYVPQAHILFKKGVYENIKIGNPHATSENLERAIQIADFSKDLDNLSQGLYTMVGESGSTLSGGQKQRLSIARALIKDPKILILDDSLSAVDAKTEDNIIEQIKTFRGDKTNIIIAHRFSAIKDANIIFVLEKGKIVKKGTHDELIKQEGWYKNQYINQITVGDSNV